MTNEELLLVDLCARQLYGVKVWYKYATWPNPKYLTCLVISDNKIWISSKLNKLGDSVPFEEAGEILIKPYLRPLSSMTEDEKKELKILFDAENVTDNYISFIEGGTLEEYESQISYSFCHKVINWLDKKMFDFRTNDKGQTLIEAGLALVAPKDMYNNKVCNNQ